MLFKLLAVGFGAGMISGMVKIGWEVILPPRTQSRNEVNPPQKLLQQLGFSRQFTHAYFYFSQDQKVYYVALFLHFGFSIFFAECFALFYKIWPLISLWQGTLYGIIIWFVFHIVLLPVIKTIPSPMNQPLSEHISEILGHAVWSWSIYLVVVALMIS
ncbi:DUF1440 domain-containing protein [Leuconostoc palmae]|uniref:DUF1440 domain-containing protein n=1 Tax=Leuconostoc palmae TaxID=501487 RepID=UPI001C7D4E2B|nr:DUF1440 domain-containing protein [Leuconostoc palmae]